VSSRSPRSSSTNGDIGWCSAKGWRKPGSASTGTKALDRYGRNSTANENAPAACTLLTSSPHTTDHQATVTTKPTTTARASSQFPTSASGRNPRANAAATARPVVTTLRSTDATT
jgi:hypothetical protein